MALFIRSEEIARSVERLAALGVPMTRDLQLAPGLHRLPWTAFAENFGITAQRQLVIGGMRDALETARRWDASTAWVGGDLVGLAHSGRSATGSIVLDADHLAPVTQAMRDSGIGQDAVLSVAALKSGVVSIEGDEAIRMASIDSRTGVRRGLIELILNDVAATPRP